MLLDAAFLTAANHLLRDAPWARERLRAHAGRSARLEFAGVAIDLRITDEGLFGGFSAVGVEPDLVLELPVAALAQAVDGREAAMRAARLRGNVEFAETLGFVLRNLSWDVEEDLSRLTGDVAAHRLVGAADTLRRELADSGRRLADGVAEYTLHEAALVAPKEAIADFCREVDELRDQFDRLDARLRRLERGASR